MASRYSPFRLIKDFLTGDMPRKLSQLEQNVKEKFESDNGRAHGPYELTDIKTASCRAQPWQFVRLNPAAAMRVMIPSPREPGVTGWIVLKNIGSSTNNIEVRPVGGTIDFSATVSMTAPLESLILVPDREANNWCAIRSSADSIGIGLPGEVLTTVAGPALDWALIVNANIDAAAAIEVSKLAGSSTPGDVLTDVAGVPTWAAPSGGGGGAWEVVYEPDLPAASNFTYTVDGEVNTIEGANWTVPVIGGHGYSFINGTGFRIAAAGTAGVFQPYSAQTAPMVVIPIGTLFAGANGISGITGPLRIRFRYVLDNGWAGGTGQKIHLGVLNRRDQGDWPTVAAMVRYNGATVDRHGFAGEGTANQVDAPAFALGGADVAELRVDGGLSGDVRFGAYSSGWPDIADADTAMWHIGGTPPAIGGQPWVIMSTAAGTGGTANSQLRGPHIFMAASPVSFIAFHMTITHLRVEQWNPGL